MTRAQDRTASSQPRSLVVLALALLSVAADCEQCQPIPDPRRGNVDRVADAVLVEGANQHTYLVTSNPEIEHLRVLDLTDERFQDGPNRYFPLSVPVGKETRRLAVASDDERFVFALDVASDRVFMIRTPADKNGDPWLQVGDAIPCERAAADLAVHKQDDAFVLTLTLPDAGSVQRVVVDADAAVLSSDVLLLPDGAVPSDVVVSLEGDAILVGDALGPAVHVLFPLTGAYDRALVVGGPQGPISTGFVDVGDGDAPVALVGRRDAEEVWALRLARAGYREDRVAVLGGTSVGGLPTATYVNDIRDSRTVCCRLLTNDSVDRGEATSAFGAVALGNGRLLYVALAAARSDGTRVVRLIDDDPLPLGQDNLADETGADTLWSPGDGEDGEAKRPDAPEFREVTEFGDPPFFEAPDTDEVLLLAWEAAPPGLRRVRVSYATGAATAFTANLQNRGARIGDRAVFTVEDPDPACPDGEIAATITSVDGAVLGVALGLAADALDDEDQLCLESSGEVRVTVEFADAFAVSDSLERSLGRLALTPREGPVPADGELPLPGAVMTIRESAAGVPNHGARLAVPLNPHLVVLGLDLAEPSGRLGEGGFGQAGYLVGNVLGRSMRFPDPAEDGAVVRARRMIISTGSADGNGLNVVISCDDAETIAGLCDSYR